ncbi:hypothetical protein CITRIK5_60133 [Citricoccus sp. K5]|nr:hypothetical protein CITRIK5_60133 [Citricoccus sp. K5]
MTAMPGAGTGAAMLRYSMVRRLVVTAAVAMRAVPAALAALEALAAGSVLEAGAGVVEVM